MKIRLLGITMLFIMLVMMNVANAQVSVTATAGDLGPTAYTTVKGAFDAINAGTHQGMIAIEITGDPVEAATAILNASGAGLASYTSISIQPSGGSPRTISGSFSGGPMIDFNGADNVTVDGLNTGGNSLTISNTSTSNTSGTSTIRFQADATMNLITNCSILGSATMANATNGGNIWFGSAAISTGNDNNTISNCNIGPAGSNLPSKCVYFSGTSNTDPGTANSGIVINNNNIFDYFSATVSSSGIDLNSGSVGTTISNNRFYQTATRTQTTTGLTHRPISINNTSGGGYQIIGNTIGFASNTGTGTYTFVFPTTTSGSFIGIYLNLGTTTVSSVQNNTIAGIAISGGASGTTTSSPFRGIYVAAGLTTMGDVTGNTIGSQSSTGSITYTSSSTSASDISLIYNFGSSNWTTNNNSIGGVTVSNSSTGAANIYGLRGNTSSTVSWTCNNNVIGGTVANSLQSTTTAAGTIVNGITITTPATTVSGNIIRNLTAAGGTGLTTSASVAGIACAASSANHTITQNSIFNLSNTNATAATTVTGIQFTSSSGTNLIARNFVYGLTTASSSATSEVNGFRISGGTATYRNNMIAVGAGTSNGSIVNGIIETGGTNNFYHNSVYVGGAPTAGAVNSFAFTSSVTTNTRNYRDNIFFNARSNSGATGKNYIVQVGGTTPNPAGLTINNNIYFANGTGAVFGRFNALDVANLAAWKVAVGQDAASFESDPQFLAPATPDLHINPAISTLAEGNGADLGVIDDFDGQTRASLTPVDIGADAGNFMGNDVVPPNINYTLLLNTVCTTDVTLSATITDASGVNVDPGTKPRLYFKKNGDANTFAGNTSGDNGWKYVEATNASSPFSFTTDYSLLQSAVVTGDVIQYFVVAQDLAPIPQVAINSGIFNAPPTSVDLMAGEFPISGTINSYTIVVAGLSGTVTVGAGGDYPTLTDAGGLFAAINSLGLSGDLMADIISSIAEPGTTMLNAIQTTSCGSGGPFSLTIKPSTTATLSGTITGAIIRLNGADNVTIDGSIGSDPNTICPLSTASRDLTITNSSTSTSSAVVWLQSNGADGATNNTIENCNIVGNTPTTTLIGIGAGSSTISTSSLGNNNSNNAYINNSISKTQYGIYSQGASAANKNANTIISQNFMGQSSPNNVGRGGILVGFENNINITGNFISGLANTSSPDVIGISIGGGVAVSATAFTTSNEVTNGLISKNYIGSAVNTGTFSAVGMAVGVTSGTNTIVNNMITGVAANSTSPDICIGILLGGGTGTNNVYYNTVTMQGTIAGTTAATQTSACLAVNNSTAPTLDIRNNSFTNTQSGNPGATMRFTTIALGFSTYGTLTSNYNNLYSAGAGPGSYHVGITGGVVAGASQTTLLNWQTTTGKDANSKNILPVFVSAADPHIVGNNPSNFPLENGAITIGSVTDDIDCESRSTDIGADEFLFTACVTPEGGTASTTTPAFCVSGTATITATGFSTENGTSYEWQSSNDNFVTNIVNTGQTDPNTFNTGVITSTTYFRLKVTCASNNSMDFSNIVTITINPLPVLICPEDFDICVDAAILDLTTLTYSPTGGTFSGPGVSGNNFNPFVATPGVHEIEYSYTDVNMCTNTCTFNITVNALPVLTCPDPFTVCELDDPFALTGALPAGGDYSGEGVNMNQFNPGDAGPGMHSITYTYTDGNGCVNECEFIITVSPAYICASFMNWVLLPGGTENGACVSETDCCEDILCYGLEYTPGTTGDLLDYTTGFLVNCIGGNSPIISNESCVLDDNSFEINGCMSNNEVLFNSSAFQETFPALPVMQGVPVILHKVCFSVPVGQSLTITEDPITNLTTSIDVGLPNNVVEFPQFTSFTITRTGPVDPMDGQDNIQCVEGASEPDIPIVVNQCGEPIDPDLISITDTPSTLTCEGTRVYYYQFLDECSGFMVDWTFTYTIDRTIGPSEVGGPAATSANVNGIENAVPPALPVVQDYCGHILSPMLVTITDDPDPIVCFGTRVYVYKWVDCSGLQFNWSFTYNINNVPVVTCPEGFEVCMNVTPFNLTGGAPAGGVYSGAGVSMGVFSPAIAGVGTHIITYTYTNAQDCPNSCTFEIEVLPLPSVSCRPSAGVCVNEPPFVITGSSPAGGVYSGAGVTGNMFNPAAAGLGPHIITYTVTGANGCTNSCSFTFTVTNCPGDPEIEIIPIDPCEEEGPYGFCNFESDCCENILCYYIRYTPGYSGELTSYTTGFTTDCFGGLSPIIYNYSCVMTDNSEEALACNGDSILFNSSGNEGTLLITQGVPVILHRICFQIPPGETAEIFEDELTNLSTSIDLISGGTVFEFPSFTPVEITRELPEVPMDGSMTVDCPIEAVPPMLPTVYDQCCNEVEPELMSIVDTPTELICAGTRVYTYAYEDCGGGVSLWHFTYTIDSGPFPDPMNGSMTVDCPDDTDIPPALPTVEDNCGNVLLPVGPPELSLKPECQGQRTYTYTYMDCDGNAQDWVFTYNVIYLPFANPIDVTVTVECPSQTNTPPSTLPTVVDNCGNELLPIGPPDVSPLPPCDGQRTYTYTYMDCAGNTQDWQYIYDIEYETFEDPMDAGTMVDCPADTEFEPALPIVFDNCGNLLAPVGPPLISPMPPCEGDRTYTYLYMDCAGNTQNWVYTYTIEYEPFSVPADEEITVDCPNDTDLPPIPPIVMDNCNNILPTPMPLISPKPPCEGDRTYSYTYMDCEGNTDTWVYTYHIEYEDFSITSPPPSTVQCPQQAYIPPILPTITDNCNVILEPVTEAVDGEVVCEGTRTYTYIYQDCEGNQDEYVFTYIVDVPPPAVPANDGITVDCPDDTTVEPTPPQVPDVCFGGFIIPMGPIVSPPLVCEGNRTYTWTYTNCAGESVNWVYTYTVEFEPFANPVDGNLIVDCPDDTDVAPELPVVMDNCNNVLNPSVPLISDKPECEGERTYTYTYMDCAGNTQDWEFTYIVEYEPFTVPVSPTSFVSCPDEDDEAPVPPVVSDNCGEILLTPSPVISADVTCQGTRTYTYNYTDCADNTAAWIYTYVVDVPVPVVPMNEGSIVDCPDDTDMMPTPPQVPDVCFGGFIIPSGPAISTKPMCEGTRTYTWTYANCAGESVDWVYTYTVIYLPFADPDDDGIQVACPDDTDEEPPLPVVVDNCNNVLTPVLFSISEKPTCEGVREYTYIYTDCDGNSHDWVFTYDVEYEEFIVPSSPTDFVTCPDEDDVAPTPPVVYDACGELLATPVPEISPDITCQGTRTYTYVYEDCTTGEAPWVYTYVVDVPLPVVPMNEGSTVECPDDTDEMPTPPQVPDVCFGGFITPSGPAISPKPTCEGLRTYTWTYANCAGESVDWVYTYNVDRTILPVQVGPPVETTSTVECYLEATAPLTLPTIEDGCGNILPAPMPVVGGTNNGTCTGTVTYTYNYVDCAGQTYVWVYTYLVDCVPIQVKVFLEGPYNISTNLMSTSHNSVLHTLPGQFPTVILYDTTDAGHPYTIAPWNYTATLGTQFGDDMGQTPYPPTVVDWVLVQIRQNGISPANTIWQCAGWVHENGDVTFPENCPLPAFALSDSFKIVVQHRNHLGVMSPVQAAEPCGTAVLSWDFRTSNSYIELFSFGQKQVEPGVWAMHAGNGKQAPSGIGIINSVDFDTWKADQGTFGYKPGDYNLNSSTNSVDETVWKNNQGKSSAVIFY